MWMAVPCTESGVHSRRGDLQLTLYYSPSYVPWGGLCICLAEGAPFSILPDLGLPAQGLGTWSIPGREGCGLPCHGGLVDGSTLSPQGSRGKERSTKSLSLLPQERPEGKLRFKGQNLTLLDPRACTAQVSARSLDSGVPPPLHC